MAPVEEENESVAGTSSDEESECLLPDSPPLSNDESEQAIDADKNKSQALPTNDPEATGKESSKRTLVEATEVEPSSPAPDQATKESKSATQHKSDQTCPEPMDSEATSNASSKRTLLDFFGSPTQATKKRPRQVPKGVQQEAKATERVGEPTDSEPASKEAVSPPSDKAVKEPGQDSKDTAGKEDKNPASAATIIIPSPIVPELVTSPSRAAWVTRRDCLIVRKDKSAKEHRTKAAAFDLDQTLLLWRCAGWPSKPEHYELWSAEVIPKLQQLSDDGYQLVIFSNQGGIRSAFNGKTASRAKGLIEWIASKLNKPLFAILSTKSKSGYHKPSPQMWEIVEQECNGGVQFDLEQSFYVGDSDGEADGKNDSYQEQGVDKMFAENVGKLRSQVLRFQNPVQFFGPSDLGRRQEARLDAKLSSMPYETPPESALKTRAALLGGYLEGNIMLILCGVQGSGKSYFCKELTRLSKWVHLSQDTIAKGKPGKREKVEKAAIEALQKGDSVVIDRMHLDVQQRNYFLEVAKNAGDVPVHVLWLNAPRHQVEERVRSRTDHPGGVQGERGAKMAVSFMEKLEAPKYQEGFSLVSIASNPRAVASFCQLYSQMCPKDVISSTPGMKSHFELSPYKDGKSSDVQLPSLSLGTQKVGKRVASSVVSLALQKGFRAVDTAPTYNNETEVGGGLSNQDGVVVVVKVPKRATQPSDVRDEIMSSLKKLQCENADLVLLHWPCDFIEADSLGSVWKTLEEMVSEGIVKALGVSNFSVGALRFLLPLCESVMPVVNQVERHPLLPQWELLDFCINHNILVQAHTCLGQGRDELLQHPTIVKVATKANRSPSQVLVEWNLKQNVAAVAKCASEEHMQELLKVLTDDASLDVHAMKALDGIGTSEANCLRFVSPPFMYKPDAPYSWGARMPKK